MAEQPDLWPNGRCDVCGNGLNEQGTCVTAGCTAGALNETNDLIAAVWQAMDAGLDDSDVVDVVDQAIHTWDGGNDG